MKCLKTSFEILDSIQELKQVKQNRETNPSFFFFFFFTDPNFLKSYIDLHFKICIPWSFM